MELTNLAPEPRTIEITHPGSGELIGIRVTVISLDDDRMSALKRKIADRRIYLEQRSKTFTAKDIEENRYDIAATAVIGWEWYGRPEKLDGDGNVIEAAIEQPTFNGAVPEYNKNNLIAVCKKLPWFFAQVSNAYGDSEAFFSHSA